MYECVQQQCAELALCVAPHNEREKNARIFFRTFTFGVHNHPQVVAHDVNTNIFVFVVCCGGVSLRTDKNVTYFNNVHFPYTHTII